MAGRPWQGSAAALIGLGLIWASAAGCQENAAPSPAPAAADSTAQAAGPANAGQVAPPREHGTPPGPGTRAADGSRQAGHPPGAGASAGAGEVQAFPPPAGGNGPSQREPRGIAGEPAFPKPKFDPESTDPAVRGRPIDPGAPLADLMEQARKQGLVDGRGNLVVKPAREIDAAKAAVAGIREYRGRYVRIYTDLPESEEIKRLPAVFDAAYPQWCAYFGVPEDCNPPWRTNAFIMQNKERFKAAGLLPDYLPQFDNGFAEGYELYVIEQPTEYYRRHLLLHEGTHSFMLTRLGSSYPTWYFEGMAELFGTHRVEDGPGGLKVQTRYMPQGRDEVPFWGRTKLIADAYRENRARNLDGVFAIEPSRNMGNEAYAWSWAACYFFDTHPEYQERFRTLFKLPAGSDFMESLFKLYQEDQNEIVTAWQVYVTGLDYGYDLARAAIQFGPGEPLPAGGAEATLAADRGWQSTGFRLEAGHTYDLAASGRYRVADQGSGWYSEPGGVTIRYHDGLPLGTLVAAILPDEAGSGPSPLIRPIAVGAAGQLEAEESGTLYLKINESAAGLADNDGTLRVMVKEAR